MSVSQDAATLTEARRGITASLIAVKGHLDTPYPDDPRWTPWTRFIERELQRLDESRAALSRLASLAGRADTLETALRQIANLSSQDVPFTAAEGSAGVMRKIARRALLAAGSPTGQEQQA